MNIKAYILCGGKSVRMGECKANFIHNGIPFMEIVANIAKEAGFTPILIGKTGQNLSSSNYPVLFEKQKEHHPLYGVSFALDKCTESHALILPCDYIYLQPNLLSRFMQCTSFTIAIDKRIHPLVGLYPKNISQKAKLFASLNKPVKELAYSASTLEFPCNQLRNINRPEEI